jgi:hypothetical protein
VFWKRPGSDNALPCPRRVEPGLRPCKPRIKANKLLAKLEYITVEVSRGFISCPTFRAEADNKACQALVASPNGGFEGVAVAL